MISIYRRIEICVRGASLVVVVSIAEPIDSYLGCCCNEFSFVSELSMTGFFSTAFDEPDAI